MSLYGLIIGICLTIGVWYFEKYNNIIPKDKESLFSFGTIVSALTGARVYHVIDQWSYYSQDYWQIFNTRAGGLGIYGGLIGGLLFIILYSWISKTRLLPILDLITPILPLTQSVGRLGNFFNREIPSWWIEAILTFFLFIVLHKLPKKYSSTGVYLIGYGLIRFFTEFFRSDTWIINDIKIAHIISLIFIVTGIFILRFNVEKRVK